MSSHQDLLLGPGRVLIHHSCWAGSTHPLASWMRGLLRQVAKQACNLFYVLREELKAFVNASELTDTEKDVQGTQGSRDHATIQSLVSAPHEVSIAVFAQLPPHQQPAPCGSNVQTPISCSEQ